MIGKLIRSTSGTNARRNRKLVDYIRGAHRMPKPAYVGARGFVCDELTGQLGEFEALAQLARSDARPIKHLVFSFREGEIPEPEQVEQLVDACLRTTGLSPGHQVFFALHRDTKHAHIHVVLSTIDPTCGRVTPVAYWHDKLAQICVRLEMVFGLQREPGRRIELLVDGRLIRKAGRKTMAGPEVDGQVHSGIASAKTLALRDEVPIVMKSSSNWDEAHERLAILGWSYEPKRSGAILRLRRVGRSDVLVKPSALDASLSYGMACSRLGAFKPAANVCVRARDIEPARPELQPAGLWEAFRAHHQNVRERKKHEFAVLREQHRVEQKSLVADSRREISAATKTHADRRIEASIRAVLTAQALKVLRERQARERAAVHQRLREKLDYEPWLADRVKHNPGDAAAVDALCAWQTRGAERGAWSTQPPHDLHAPVDRCANGAVQDGVERILLVMRPGDGEPRPHGREAPAQRSDATALGHFDDKASASIEQDEMLVKQLRQRKEAAVRDAQLRDLRATPGFRDAVPGKVVCGVLEYEDSERLIVRAGNDLIECPVMLEEPHGPNRGVGKWVELTVPDDCDQFCGPAP